MKVGFISLEGCLRMSLTIISCGKRSFEYWLLSHFKPVCQLCAHLVVPLLISSSRKGGTTVSWGPQCLKNRVKVAKTLTGSCSQIHLCILLFCFQRNFKVLNGVCCFYWMRVHDGVNTCATRRGQRMLWSQFSPALMWLLEIVLRSQAGWQVSLPSEPSH